MSEHFTATDENRKGYFEKVNVKIPDYREACLQGKRGFLGPQYNAHHILPATSFKKSIEKLGAEKQTYVQNCQHVTPWNINNADNLIGLPHIRAFILYAQNDPELGGDEPENIKARAKSFRGRTSLDKRKEMLAEIRRASPERYPVHLPVSWGHTLYNHAVQNDITTQVWDTLDENRQEHKVNPQTVEEALKKLEKKYFNHLKNRGLGATLDNWRLRANPRCPTWYKSFTMFAGANPLR